MLSALRRAADSATGGEGGEGGEGGTVAEPGSASRPSLPALLRASVARGDFASDELALAHLLALPPALWSAMVAAAAAAPDERERGEAAARAVAARLPRFAALAPPLQREVRVLRSQVVEVTGAGTHLARESGGSLCCALHEV